MEAKADLAIASDADLERILKDVEEIEAQARYVNQVNGKQSTTFTKEDEKSLDKIFHVAEKRKKEMEELSVATKSCESDSSSSDDSGSESSSSSDSELDRLLDEVELELERKKSKSYEEDEVMDREMDQVLKDVESLHSTNTKHPKQTAARSVKSYKTASSIRTKKNPPINPPRN